MRKEEVFEIIHQNGVGQNIKCFFSSRGLSKESHVSIVNNYKYQKGLIKISVDRFNIKIHKSNFAESYNCELLIKKDDGLNLITLRLFCHFIFIDDKSIHVKALNVKYLDDNKEITQRILSN